MATEWTLILFHRVGLWTLLHVAVTLPREATVVGLTESVGDGATTTRLNVASWVSEPLVPVTAIVYVPAGVLVAVVTVSVLAVVAGFGAKVAVVRAGRPEAVRETDPSKPPVGVTETAALTAWPRITVTDAGAAPSVKSGGATTVMLNVVVRVSEPAVPVTVIG